MLLCCPSPRTGPASRTIINLRIGTITDRVRRNAFSLAEVVVSLAISGILLGGVVTAYIQSLQRAEWSGYSLAAQAIAIQQLEQARAARWDTQVTPVVDDLVSTNFPSPSVTILDLPVSGTNVVYATNYTSVSTVSVSVSPAATVKLIEVKTVWPFLNGRLYTNSAATYRAPDR